MKELAVKEEDWVIYESPYLSPHNGEVAEVKEVIPFGNSVRIGLQFILDGFHIGAYPEECSVVVEWQGA